MKYVSVLYGTDKYAYEDEAFEHRHWLLPDDSAQFDTAVINWKDRLQKRECSWFAVLEHVVKFTPTPVFVPTRQVFLTNPLSQRIELNKEAKAAPVKKKAKLGSMYEGLVAASWPAMPDNPAPAAGLQMLIDELVDATPQPATISFNIPAGTVIYGDTALPTTEE